MQSNILRKVSNVGEFKELLESYSSLVVIYFNTTWTPAHPKLKTSFEEYAAKYPRFLFIHIDMDKLSEIAEYCKVSMPPTFQFYHDQKRIHSVVGSRAEDVGKFLKTFDSL
mmetsp:Transcript_25654/g.29352  ORF Transcript_25654/g.29352 Transcript_25654/m.29352 type:complete len:111 (-) Transcript_25654:33-365(-)